jgi:hypothetical protein
VIFIYLLHSFSRRPEVLEKVIQAGAIPILTEIASHTNFDIRKEVNTNVMVEYATKYSSRVNVLMKAAFSLTNIACHGTKYIQALPNNVLLPGMKPSSMSSVPLVHFSNTKVNRIFGICTVRGSRADQTWFNISAIIADTCT